jgi:hypothetical protein
MVIRALNAGAPAGARARALPNPVRRPGRSGGRRRWTALAGGCGDGGRGGASHRLRRRRVRAQRGRGRAARSACREAGRRGRRQPRVRPHAGGGRARAGPRARPEQVLEHTTVAGRPCAARAPSAPAPTIVTSRFTVTGLEPRAWRTRTTRAFPIATRGRSRTTNVPPRRRTTFTRASAAPRRPGSSSRAATPHRSGHATAIGTPRPTADPASTSRGTNARASDTTRQPRRPGTACTFPAASRARTANECRPSASRPSATGEPHGADARRSTEHVNVTSGSEAANASATLRAPVTAPGPSTIADVGATVSIVKTTSSLIPVVPGFPACVARAV